MVSSFPPLRFSVLNLEVGVLENRELVSLLNTSCPRESKGECRCNMPLVFYLVPTRYKGELRDNGDDRFLNNTKRRYTRKNTREQHEEPQGIEEMLHVEQRPEEEHKYER